MKREIILFLFLFFVGEIVFGQDLDSFKGINSGHSYDASPIDSIDTATGNLLVKLPLISYKQKGSLPDFTLQLLYNSTTWQVQSFNQLCDSCVDDMWIPDFHAFEVVRGGSFRFSTLYFPSPGDSSNPAVVEEVVDDTGARHTFYGIAQTNPQYRRTMDGSGVLDIVTTTGTNPSDIARHDQVFDSRGLQHQFGDYSSDSSVAGFSDKWVDPDGNAITPHAPGGQAPYWIDSVGRMITSPVMYRALSNGCQSYQFPSTDTTSAAYTFCYAKITISSNFNIANEDDFTSDEYPLASVQLPDGSMYRFFYNTRGSLSEIDLPTGGIIRYTYSTVFFTVPGPTPGAREVVHTRSEDAADGSPLRTWTYDWSQTLEPTIVTDPLGNQKAILGTGITSQEPITYTEIQYEGPIANQVKLLTTDKCVQRNGGFVFNQWGEYFPPPLLSCGHKTTLSNGKISQTVLTYDPQALIGDPNGSSDPDSLTPMSIGFVTDTKNYDYGVTGLESLLKEQKIQYKWQQSTENTNWNVYLNANFLSSVFRSEFDDPSGNPVAKTTFGYDESGSPQGTYGHLTSTHVWMNTSGGSLNTSVAYDSTGMPVLKTDPNGTRTKLDAYTCAGLFPGIITSAFGTSVAETTTYTHDCTSGKLTSSTDPNGTVTQYSYDDPMNRLTSIKSSVGTNSESWSFFSYPSNTEIHGYHDKNVKGDGLIQSTTKTDGLGEIVQTVEPSGAIVDTVYDQRGAVLVQTNPYMSTSDTTFGYTSYTHDALGRTRYTCNPDNGSAVGPCHPGNSFHETQYSSNVKTIKDEAGNSWIESADALGRITTVVEPSGSQTVYTYDNLDNLTCVEQHGGVSGTGCSSDPSNDASSPWRVRRFAYDSLSRLTSSTNPETGTTLYSYDPNGNLIQKTSPSPNQASGTTTLGYCYDALNRMTAKFYGSPNCTSPSSGALVASYAYDTSTIPGAQNTIGRLTSESSIANGVAYSQRLPYVYDAMGRIKNERQCPLLPCATPNELQYTYDLSGNVTSSNNGVPNSGTPQIGWTNSYDAAGRLAKLQSTWDDATHPAVLFEADQTINGITPYGPFGLTAAQHGISPATPQASLLAETRAYDIRGRLTLKQVNAIAKGPASVSLYAWMNSNRFSIPNFPAVHVHSSCGFSCGSVTYVVDGIAWGTVPLGADGNFSNDLNGAPSSFLTVGDHLLVVVFAGNVGYSNTNSATIPYTVTSTNPVQTNVTAWMEPWTMFSISNYQTNVHVHADCNSACGNVTYFVDGVSWGTAPLNASGDFGNVIGHDAPSNFLAIGSHQLTVVFAGYSGYSGALSNVVPYQVTNVGTSPTVVHAQMTAQTFSSTNPSPVHVHVDCGTSCGAITYVVDGQDWGTVPLDASGNFANTLGGAPSSFLTLGQHQLIVKFTGDPVYAPNQSDPISYEVTQ